MRTNNIATTASPAVKQASLSATVFVKPFLLATLAAVLMPLVIGFLFSLVSDALLNRHMASQATPASHYKLNATQTLPTAAITNLHH